MLHSAALSGVSFSPIFGLICLQASAQAHALTDRSVHDFVCACRVSTAGLLMLLCRSYPDLFIVFLLLLMLDLFSHWFQMYSTLVAGSATHKASALYVVA